jgi:hypothetical protein
MDARKASNTARPISSSNFFFIPILENGKRGDN